MSFITCRLYHSNYVLTSETEIFLMHLHLCRKILTICFLKKFKITNVKKYILCSIIYKDSKNIYLLVTIHYKDLANTATIKQQWLPYAYSNPWYICKRLLLRLSNVASCYQNLQVICSIHQGHYNLFGVSYN